MASKDPYEGLCLEQPEDIDERLAAIRRRLSMASPDEHGPNIHWRYRGKTVAHHHAGGHYGVIGGRYEGMGEMQHIATVAEPGDASIILCAPEDLDWCIKTIEMLLHPDWMNML